VLVVSAGVGNQDDDAAAVVSTALEGARTEEHGVINRGAAPAESCELPACSSATLSETLSQPLDAAPVTGRLQVSAHRRSCFEADLAAPLIDHDAPRRRPSPAKCVSDNVAELQAAVRKIPAGAGTSIYDAVLLGSRALERRGDDRRRVIILVTDAGENHQHVRL